MGNTSGNQAQMLQSEGGSVFQTWMSKIEDERSLTTISIPGTQQPGVFRGEDGTVSGLATQGSAETGSPLSGSHHQDK